MNSFIKAVLISIIAAILTVSFQVINTSRIQEFPSNLIWEEVNEMNYQQALKHIRDNTRTITGITAFTEQITEPANWKYLLIDILYKAIGYLFSLIALLFWVKNNKKSNK